MAWYYYLAYLLVVFASSIVIAKFAKVKVDVGRFLQAVLPVFLIFVAWDAFAVERGHWRFGMEYMSGMIILNQPIEELAFFLIIPFFYVVVWETVKAKLPLKFR